MYYGTLIILWNFSNALAIPILGLNNENKYYNPNHQYNISWDYDQLVSHLVNDYSYSYYKTIMIIEGKNNNLNL